jgi:hypothetical protein
MKYKVFRADVKVLLAKTCKFFYIEGIKNTSSEMQEILDDGMDLGGFQRMSCEL